MALIKYDIISYKKKFFSTLLSVFWNLEFSSSRKMMLRIHKTLIIALFNTPIETAILNVEQYSLCKF